MILKNTLLIVDDVSTNLSVLSEFLSEAGYKVIVAQDGKRAIKKAEHIHPDLILLDVMMPGMDGFEVCQQLKSQTITQDIPIIFMTALADTIDKVKGFSLGASDYITKPIQSEEVLARISTHLKLFRLQRESRAHTQELEQRNLELEAFSRTVAHDLKNPLNLVINYTESVLEDCPLGAPLDEMSIKSLHLVISAGRKMVNIIDALLLLAGVSKQQQVELQPLTMSSIVSQVVEQRLAKMITDYQAEILLPNQWPVAKGYAPWIEEVWTNYLSNGLKYGGQPPRLELGAERIFNDHNNHNNHNDQIKMQPEIELSLTTTTMIKFWVRDHGPGLSPAECSRLFTPFTRLHQVQVEGHGLGLSIVRQIVEKLGGQVGVESTVGQGSLFYFTLPSN